MENFTEMQEVKKRIYENELEYEFEFVGDFYISVLELPEESRTIGHYGRLLRGYLRENFP